MQAHAHARIFAWLLETTILQGINVARRPNITKFTVTGAQIQMCIKLGGYAPPFTRKINSRPPLNLETESFFETPLKTLKITLRLTRKLSVAKTRPKLNNLSMRDFINITLFRRPCDAAAVTNFSARSLHCVQLSLVFWHRRLIPCNISSSF